MNEPVTDKQSLADIALHAVRAANPDARCIVLVLDEDPSGVQRCIGARGVSRVDTIDELCAAAKRLLDDEAGSES